MRLFRHRALPFQTSIASVISGILLASGVVQAIDAISDPIFLGAQSLFYHLAHWIHPYRFGLSPNRVQSGLFYSYGLSAVFCLSLGVAMGRWAKLKPPSTSSVQVK